MTERPDLEGLSTLAAAFSIRADDAGRLAKLLVEVCSSPPSTASTPPARPNWPTRSPGRTRPAGT
jgi:hypothetical protein